MTPRFLPTILIGALALPMSASATVVAFQNSADTTMIQDSSVNNFGGRSEILLGNTGSGRQRAGLISFDVTSLAGLYTSIESVTVRFVVAREAATNTFNLSLMREMHSGWVEGSSNGVLEAGAVSWDSKAEPTVAWNSGGARLTSDVYGSMGSMTFTGGTTTVGTVIDVVLNPSTLAANVDTLTEIIDLWAGGSNAGIQIYGGSGQWGVYSAEATAGIGVTGTLADRPQLIVDYTPVPEPSSAALLGLAGLGLAMRRRR